MNDHLARKTALQFLVISFTLFGLHFGLVELNLFPNLQISKWWLNYIFLIPLSATGLYLVAYRYRKTSKVTSIGKNYILYTVLKMILAILFLLPWLLTKSDTSRPMVIHFFIAFFPFLLVETILLVRLLNTPLDENLKNEENQAS